MRNAAFKKVSYQERKSENIEKYRGNFVSV